MKLLMLPHYNDLGLDNGVGQVVYNYHQWFPKVGIEVVTNPKANYDLSYSHLGHYPQADIHGRHGLYFNQVNTAQANANKDIINPIVQANAVRVPSEYVAATIRREIRINPHIVPHGVNFSEWQHNYKHKGYILWNKNRNSAVCNPQAVYELAERFPKFPFVTTYTNESLDNVTVTGRLPFDQMKAVIQHTNIYLATAHETFGIGVLEALASGVPVLGFNWGGTADIIKHKVNGYLVPPNDYDALADGLEWLLANREKLVDNCKETAKQYSWLSVVKQLKGAFEDVLS